MMNQLKMIKLVIMRLNTKSELNTVRLVCPQMLQMLIMRSLNASCGICGFANEFRFFYETSFRLSTTGLDNLYVRVQLCTLKYSPSAQVVYSSTVYLYINHVHIFMCVPLI